MTERQTENRPAQRRVWDALRALADWRGVIRGTSACAIARAAGVNRATAQRMMQDGDRQGYIKRQGHRVGHQHYNIRIVRAPDWYTGMAPRRPWWRLWR